LFVLLQPKADEGDRTDDGVKAGGDGMWTEASARGTSAAETTGDDTEADVNVSAKTLTIDAAAALEV
jgi:hypothetical protein